MKIYFRFNKGIIKILKQGGVGIIPTDTLYGLVGSALSKKAVERIYKLRRRNLKKPMIVLISLLKDLELFGVTVDEKLKKILDKFWPGKVSIILPCKLKKFSYLHRGTKTLAFRLPAKKTLLNLLRKTGPSVAPSANFEGDPPAKTIKEAKKYFNDKVDFYIDKGRLEGKSSTLIQIKKSKVLVRRKGTVKISTKYI